MYKSGDDKMLEFKTLEQLKNCEELNNMGRYQWQTVMLDGKEVIVCTTDQQYEDIIWGGIQSMLEELTKYYAKDFDTVDLASEARDFILGKLESKFGMTFVNVYDEY